MTIQFQASLFDVGLDETPGRSEGGGDHGDRLSTRAPTLGALDGRVRRTHLTRGAWVDVRPGWVAGSDEVFAQLVTSVPWKAERRQMYERVVDVPRLLKFYGVGETLPDPLLAAAREALNEHYAPELGEEFVTAGMCYYRDGNDSVAWHGDTIGRGRREDTMVAILSLGEARRLLLRPRGGGPARLPQGDGPLGFSLGHGDLLVMGGSCQRTWEHAILKTSKPVGPRISVQFRPRGVR
jgi:alkylated DNA repair dioxygenase AlkB